MYKHKSVLRNIASRQFQNTGHTALMLTKYKRTVFNVEYLSLQVILILINIELATTTMTTVLLFNHKFLEKRPTSVNTRMFLLGTDQALKCYYRPTASLQLNNKGNTKYNITVT